MVFTVSLKINYYDSQFVQKHYHLSRRNPVNDIRNRKAFSSKSKNKANYTIIQTLADIVLSGLIGAHQMGFHEPVEMLLIFT